MASASPMMQASPSCHGCQGRAEGSDGGPGLWGEGGAGPGGRMGGGGATVRRGFGGGAGGEAVNFCETL